MRENLLWYKAPAIAWDECLPIGNGRLGAMVWGGITEDTLFLNQDSLWYGPKRDRENPEASKYVGEIREAIFNENYDRANLLARTALTSIPKYFGAYQPLAELKMWFINGCAAESSAHFNFANYKRSLDLSSAVATVEYDINGIHYKREHLASYPDGIIAIRLTCSEPVLSMQCNLMRRPFTKDLITVNDNTIAISGNAGDGGINFFAAVSGYCDGKSERIGDFLTFSESREIVLYVSADTDYYNADFKEKCLERLKFTGKDFEDVKNRHIEDYASLYNRVSLELPSTDSQLPTGDRIVKARKGEKDPGLCALVFNMGRYLTIAGSRQKSQAMNLQGIWNNVFQPPWECNYTININTECNYWPAEVCNLSECHEPLFDLVEKMLPNGKKTAKSLYGCNGFMAHHCTDIWGDTAIEGICFPSSIWPMGGAWLSLHFWERYCYTMDIDFLRDKAYPVLYENALFFSEYMTPDKNGHLVTGPTLSPENVFIREDGSREWICMGTEMDNSIVRELLNATISAAKILDVDHEFSQKLSEMIEKIRTPQIGKNGGVMEWMQDYDEALPGHRHISHLFALMPGTSFDVKNNPELKKAYKTSLDLRNDVFDEHSDGQTCGWASGWMSSAYARLGYAKRAEDLLYNYIEISLNKVLLDAPPEIKLDDTHSRKVPFQIDGNMANTAAIAEMLMQSHEGFIAILPAVGDTWKDGKVSGLCARGGFEVDIDWTNLTAQTVKIKSKSGLKCAVKIGEGYKVNTSFEVKDGILYFDTVKGEEYIISKS